MHWYYELRVLGYKYNMNDLAASIGLAQLKLPIMNARRGEIIRQYMDGLSGNNNVVPLLPFVPEKYVYQMFGIRVDRRDDMMIHLKSKGVATGCHYTPLSVQPLFAPWGGNCPYIENEVNRSSRCRCTPICATMKSRMLSIASASLLEPQTVL